MTHNCAEEAKRKIEHSKHYCKERLEKLRYDFLKDFISK
ncbi:hypothetical protein PBR_0242 [Segatella baroniae B14]|uniref:Uncharacterized protein n=1 Tax=Segatella baroniae B14 TaxID=752555 RepID=D8E0C2_9BACT|nr:hypothetical protein PBR_0242 [Segatella baroniae B14]